MDPGDAEAVLQHRDAYLVLLGRLGVVVPELFLNMQKRGARKQKAGCQPVGLLFLRSVEGVDYEVPSHRTAYPCWLMPQKLVGKLVREVARFTPGRIRILEDDPLVAAHF